MKGNETKIETCKSMVAGAVVVAAGSGEIGIETYEITGKETKIEIYKLAVVAAGSGEIGIET